MSFDPETPEGRHALGRLAIEPVAWLTTVTPGGQPQTFPIWFLWEDGEILVFSDHRAKRNANIEANPRVSFHLDDDGDGGDIVIVEGEARTDPGTPSIEAHAAYLVKYRDRIDAELGGPAKMAQTYSVAIRIRPGRCLAYGAPGA
jgi:PPOX class probable F420-dependent enzyme